MTESQKLAILMLRHYLGNGDGPVMERRPNWMAIASFSASCGIQAVMMDAIQKMYDENLVPGEFHMNELEQDVWGNFLVGTERSYDNQKSVVKELVSFFASHGLEMAVLKGYSLSLNYPCPSHRTSADVDIWLCGDRKKGDVLVESELHLKVDDSVDHHSLFMYKDVMVENHYDFINVHSHASSALVESRLRQLSAVRTVDADTGVSLMSADFDALFILRHAAMHFAASGITLRHVLDWAFFVRKHGHEVDWTSLYAVVEKSGMGAFAAVLNDICRHFLGFREEALRGGADKQTVLRVFSDMLSPEFQQMPPSSYAGIILWKLRRWKANGWKRNLVYDESLPGGFVRQALAHLRKPASLVR